MQGDLHCHTARSDGSMEPAELVSYASRLGLGAIAVTDHDTFSGSEAAVKAGAAAGIKVISGIEISAVDKKTGKKLHLLCYNFKKPNALRELCNGILQRRTAAGEIMLERASKRFPVTRDEVMRYAGASDSIYKQHIIRALIELGYTDRIFGDLFRELFSRKSASNIISEIEYPDIRETLSLAKQSGGVCILAHPAYYDNFDILPELIRIGLDGVEVWHPRNPPESRRQLIDIAEENGLLMTGGTDFHGAFNSTVLPLGSCVCDIPTILFE